MHHTDPSAVHLTRNRKEQVIERCTHRQPDAILLFVYFNHLRGVLYCATTLGVVIGRLWMLNSDRPDHGNDLPANLQCTLVETNEVRQKVGNGMGKLITVSAYWWMGTR